MLDDFMARSALAGIGVASAAAPLGCFVVWRRMAYFGEATAHAAILGVALALALDASIFAGTLFICLIVAWVATQLSGRGYAMDTLLGVLAHSSLAVGRVGVDGCGGRGLPSRHSPLLLAVDPWRRFERSFSISTLIRFHHLVV